MNNSNKYNLYLLNRSKLGLFYRKFYLYPKLSNFLQGAVLDIGCGIGDFISYYHNSFGIDVNSENIRYCKSINLQCDLYKYSDYKKYINKFNSFLLDNVLEHIKDPNEILTFVNNISKKKDRLVVGVPGLKGYSYDDDHKVFYDLKKLNYVVSQFNFKYKKHFYTPLNTNILSKYIKQHCLYAIYEK